MLTFLNINPAIVALFTLTVSVLLIVVGWRVVFHNAKKLATRNETYNFVSQLLSLLDELLKESISYWTTSDEVSAGYLQSQKLISKTHRFKKKLALLDTRGLAFDCSKELKNIRRAITLDAQRASDVSTAKKLNKIEDLNYYGAQLTNKVLIAYQNKYPMS